MPLDPQVQALLEQTAALNLPELHTQTPAEARAGMEARGRAMPPGPEVARINDVVADGPHGGIPVRVYTPAGAGPLPLVVYYHGGGWVIGNIESHDAVCRHLAVASGCIVASVDYRLAPEHKFPAAAEDSYAAAVWLHDHAESLDADGRRLAVAGDSAGGNLSAVVSLMARDRGGPAIAFQALVYPVTDASVDSTSYKENAEGYLLTRNGMIWFWDHYLNEEAEGKHPHAAPLQAEDLRGLPPALVITAEYDPLRDEGEAYAERLKAAAVPVTLHRYDGMIHGFFGMVGVIDRAADAVQEVGDALRKSLAAPVGTH